ncbi:MAG: RES family NAD+ phosphorylase [Actinomycetales bacterium]|jgi:hypothetical protein|uniref:RES family NAD+ phosphorylase n=1 Tax=Candidatus Phosphoribacter hodrii TaxID=2953743 RepID=A0A935M5G3_9MICO|nr:RES family NAD+ phosphorylase [Candidatus Phosphoribacter hodrii]MBP8882632.1 RES family NAD+ phosphorylase [Dermatophilaceae bacterium]OPZ51705.1 MAG: RES domain protein [bacterium ADurb.BinA028]MBL0002795.1 RES family NAD+ phosphorylase [Candidatus Phosphoribacter hodrii]HNV15380.1 RES family NAD+ phosphorylase [Dermatophilaceae bacterium]
MTPKPQPKTPRKPPKPLTRRSSDLVGVRPTLWRIGATIGDYVLEWNEARDFGPLRTMRWDPHHPPQSVQPDRAVIYASPSPITAVAEKFQKYRTIDPFTAAPCLYGWSATRQLTLLDLRGNWPINNKGSASMPMGPRNVCRAWSAAILDTWPELDGLLTRSTMDGRDTYVLFPPARTSMPDEPRHARLLTDPAVYCYLDLWADEINYDIADAPWPPA